MFHRPLILLQIVQLILFIVDSGCTMFKRRLIAVVQASVVNVKWCLLKITLQAPFLNVQMMYVHISSDLAPQRQMVSAENNTSGPVPQCSDDVCSHQFRPRSSSNDV
ncbi:hypothetical protein Tco_0427207 [Tanacetum coccineum]